MFTIEGFLGTKALLFMDVVTIYFALLPFLLAFSIKYAINKEFKKHFISQSFILATTLIIVLIFEVGVRLTGGFLEYAKTSSISYDFLVLFLIIHIIIAILAVAGWLYLFINSYKQYKNNGFESFNQSNHKKIAKAIFISITLSSIMGICIYLFLFVF